MPTGRIILCPGQGAQTIGMGKAWHDASPEARAVFQRADTILGNRLGAPLSKLCFEGPADRLNQTDVSQPAIYVAGIACWAGLLARWGAGGSAGVSEGGVVATAGLSLGEYTALHIAGAFTFEVGLELVILRGRAMQDAADAIKLADGSPGSGMVALIGADEAQAEQVCDKARDGEVLVCANFNAPGQIVVSGSIAACKRAVEIAGQMGLRAAPLPVAGAFHSPLMQPAANRLAAALKSAEIHPPRCPVVSNVTAEPHAPTGASGSRIADSIRARLVDQLTRPVRWEQGCRWLAANAPRLASGTGPQGSGTAGPGSGTPGPCEFIELAPGKTLAGLMRRIDKSIKVVNHDEPSSPT